MGKCRMQSDLIPSTPREVKNSADEAASRISLPIPKVSVLPSAQLQVGGRLARCVEAWATLTSDAWVLQTVQGFRVEFNGRPQQLTRPHPIMFSQRDASLVDEEVSALLQKGAICLTS